MDFGKALELMRDGYSVQSMSRTKGKGVLKINKSMTGFVLCNDGTESVYVIREEDVFAMDYEVLPKRSLPTGVTAKVFKSREAVNAVPMTHTKFFGVPAKPSRENPYAVEEGYAVKEINSYKTINDVEWVDEVTFKIKFVDIFQDDIKELRDN